MKIQKALLVLFLALTLSLSVFRSGCGAGVLADGDALLLKAEQKGRVRVIVTFGVSDLTKLQQASQAERFSGPEKESFKAGLSRARQADEALATAINDAGAGIFGELGLEEKVKHVFKVTPQALLVVDRAQLLALAGHQGVTRVVEDKLVPVPVSRTTAEDDQVNAARSYGVNIINAPQAWDKGYDGDGWYVAVLDTGVRTSHEMFTGKDIVEACFSTTNDYASSLCPGGVPEAEGPGSAVPPDRYYHGTHVAGIAVGKQPEGDLSGVAPQADLIAIQVFSYIPDWNDVGSFFSDQIKGLEYVYGLRAAHGIASINLSLGDGIYDGYCDDEPRKPIIDQLRAAGIAVAVSNGNGGYCGSLSSPACISSAVSVGGSDYNDRKYSFNNWHPVMQDIFAPGVSIYSSMSTGDKDYALLSGTSMAAPHVAGAWAVFRQTAPTATVSELENIMEQTGTPVESGCQTEPSSGPRLDVAAVVDHYLELGAVPTANAGPDQVVDEGASVSLDASASTSNSGHGLTYAWVQSEGPVASLSDPAIYNPSFIAPEAGTDGEQLVFELTVGDDFNGLTATDTVTVSVNDQDRNKPPTANAGQDQTANTGTTVRLDGSASAGNSNTGAELYYAWVQTGGVAVTLSDPNAPSPTFVGPIVQGASVLEFELLVIDSFNDLTGADTVQVTINQIDNNVDPGFLPAATHEGEIIGLKTDGNGTIVYLVPEDPAGIENNAGRPDVIGYLFETVIKCELGAAVQVTWQLPRSVPRDAGWYIHREEVGWNSYPVVWSEDRIKAIITLTDGGEGDRDGEADGAITFLSGLGNDQPDDSAGGGSGGGSGCFLGTSLD